MSEFCKYCGAGVGKFKREGEGTCYKCKDQDFAVLIKELISILEKEEESESGYLFRPNQINSCRVLDGLRIDEICIKLKQLCEQ